MYLSGSDGEDDDDIFDTKYLAAQMDLDPGSFNCQVVWTTYFLFHPRLKAGTTTRGYTMSRGISLGFLSSRQCDIYIHICYKQLLAICYYTNTVEQLGMGQLVKLCFCKPIINVSVTVL